MQSACISYRYLRDFVLWISCEEVEWLDSIAARHVLKSKLTYVALSIVNCTMVSIILRFAVGCAFVWPVIEWWRWLEHGLDIRADSDPFIIHEHICQHLFMSGPVLRLICGVLLKVHDILEEFAQINIDRLQFLQPLICINCWSIYALCGCVAVASCLRNSMDTLYSWTFIYKYGHSMLPTNFAYFSFAFCCFSSFPRPSTCGKNTQVYSWKWASFEPHSSSLNGLPS